MDSIKIYEILSPVRWIGSVDSLSTSRVRCRMPSRAQKISLFSHLVNSLKPFSWLSWILKYTSLKHVFKNLSARVDQFKIRVGRFGCCVWIRVFLSSFQPSFRHWFHFWYYQDLDTFSSDLGKWFYGHSITVHGLRGWSVFKSS